MEVLPHDFNAGRTEGVCSWIKDALSTIGHRKVADEYLRAKFVLQQCPPLSQEDREWAESNFKSVINERICSIPILQDKLKEDGEARLHEIFSRSCPKTFSSGKRKRNSSSCSDE